MEGFRFDLPPPFFNCDNATTCLQPPELNDANISYPYYDFPFDPNPDITKFIDILNTVVTPLIVFPGIVGNLLSLLVFLWTHLKVQSSSIYLAFLNIADTGFLLSLIPPWTGWSFGANWFNQNGWCHITIFATYTFGLLSVWAVVFISLERYIVVFYPWLRHRLCSRKSTLYVIGTMTILACLFNSYMFWTLKSNQIPGTDISTPCIMKGGAGNETVLHVMTVAETLFRFIVPGIMLLCLNGRIGLHIARTMKLEHKQSSRMSCSGDHLIPAAATTDCVMANSNKLLDNRNCVMDMGGISHNFYCESCNYVPSQTGDMYSMDNTGRLSTGSTKRNPRIGVVAAHYRESRERRRRYQLQATRSLVLISTVFIILNFPYITLRVYTNILTSSDLNQIHESMSLRITGEICLFLHYLNFAVNFIMFVLFSSHFRRGLRRFFLRVRKNACRQCASLGKSSINLELQQEKRSSFKNAKANFILKIRKGSVKLGKKETNQEVK